MRGKLFSSIMMLILYHFLHAVAFLVFLPKLLLLMVCKKKYRKSFFRRFGFGLPRLPKTSTPRIWIHAVSMGEVAAARAILSSFPTRNFSYVISTTTETGQERARHLFPDAEAIIYWPYDFFLVVRKAFRCIQPTALILVEGDLWYGALRRAKRCKVLVAVVNGKISESSFRRFSKVSHFTKSLMGTIDLFCMQSELFKQRYLSLGAQPNKVFVTGNVKFDSITEPMSESEKESLKQTFSLSAEDFVIVAGSTHSGEEEIILDALPPHSKLLLVPRHPERFQEVALLLQRRGLSFERYSALVGSNHQLKSSICLIDTMGLLLKLYQIANVAIVAGSFSERVGGHNILEPAQFGVPVIVGPHMFSQSAIFESAYAEAAVIQVSSTEELKRLLAMLIKNPDERQRLGKSGQLFCSSMRGASRRTVDAVSQLVAPKTKD